MGSTGGRIEDAGLSRVLPFVFMPATGCGRQNGMPKPRPAQARPG